MQVSEAYAHFFSVSFANRSPILSIQNFDAFYTTLLNYRLSVSEYDIKPFNYYH